MAANEFNWMQPIATLSATIVGGLLTHCFTTFRENRKQIDDRFAAYDRALAVLFDMHNSLESYRQDCVAAYKDRYDGWLSAPVSPTRNWGRFRFHNALVFLLETKKANIFPELLLIETNFDALSSLIQRRDDLLLREAHPKLAPLLGKADGATQFEIEQTLGADVTNQLKIMWRGISKLLDEQIAGIGKAVEDVRDAAALTHPGRPTIKPILFKDGVPT